MAKLTPAQRASQRAGLARSKARKLASAPIRAQIQAIQRSRVETRPPSSIGYSPTSRTSGFRPEAKCTCRYQTKGENIGAPSQNLCPACLRGLVALAGALPIGAYRSVQAKHAKRDIAALLPVREQEARKLEALEMFPVESSYVEKPLGAVGAKSDPFRKIKRRTANVATTFHQKPMLDSATGETKDVTGNGPVFTMPDTATHDAPIAHKPCQNDSRGLFVADVRLKIRNATNAHYALNLWRAYLLSSK